MPPIRTVNSGEMPYASDWNSLASLFNTVLGEGSLDSLRHLLTHHRPNLVELFEAVEDFSMPDSSRTAGSASESDVPWVTARPVWLEISQYQYQVSTDVGQNVTLYAPVCDRNSYGIANGDPPGESGDRFWAAFNFQSGRWEIVNGSSPAAGYNAQSFVLRTDLLAGALAIAERTMFRETNTSCYYGASGDPSQMEWSLCWCHPKRVFHWVFDRLGEFEGSMDLHCGIAHILADTPTYKQLCIEEGAGSGRPEWFQPSSGGSPVDWDDSTMEWDESVWEIQRVVCANFTGCGCVLSDPCAAGTYYY